MSNHYICQDTVEARSVIATLVEESDDLANESTCPAVPHKTYFGRRWVWVVALGYLFWKAQKIPKRRLGL